MARKSGHIAIMLFDERLLSFMRVRPSSKGLNVLQFEQEQGQWSAEDGSLAEALKAFVHKHKVHEDEVYSVLPRHDMTARILVLPSNDLDEVRGMVRLSAEEFMPYPAEELVIDQSILQKLPDDQSRVLAVFAHRDVVDTHVRLLEQAGAEPEKIFVSSACLASAAIAAKDDAEERYALVNLASGGLEVLVMNGKRLEFGRGVATSQDWSSLTDEASESREELSIEVRASLSAHKRESEDGMGVDQIYVCSSWADVSPATDMLFQETGYDAAPADFVKSLLGKSAEKVDGLPLVSIGGALAAQGRAPVAMNLVPESLLEARERSQRRKSLITGGAVAAVILVALGLLYSLAVHQRSVYIHDLEKRVQALQPAAEEVIRKQRDLMVLQDRVNREGSALELLAAVCELAPADGFNVTRFFYDRGKELRIQGRVDDLAKVTLFSQSLREEGEANVPLLKSARQGKTTQVQERGEMVHQYEIEVPFPQEEETDEEALNE